MSGWPEMARARLEHVLRALLRPEPNLHRYLSEACLHHIHGDCAGGCEYCGTPCVCGVCRHQEVAGGTAGDDPPGPAAVPPTG